MRHTHHGTGAAFSFYVSASKIIIIPWKERKKKREIQDY